MNAPPSEVLLIVGARPNFMKVGPIIAAMRRGESWRPRLVHTGQHYDERMSDLFFRDLGLPRPDANLGVGSGSHAWQTGEVMVRFEKYLEQQAPPPDLVLVVGDVNSTLACSIVAAKAGIPLAHVEAGLRSFDRGMPEELNRLCTDQLSDVCYVTEQAGLTNLTREGREADSCPLVGNTMIDTLLEHRERAARQGAGTRSALGVADRPFAVLTLHRPSNVDLPGPFREIVEALETIAGRIPILWPIHPRALARAREFDLLARIEGIADLRLIDPQGYLDFLGLMDAAALILTDSGGIQEEATVLKTPCVTLRENTERPVTLEMGGNVLVGSDAERIVRAASSMLELDRDAIGTPPLWDGRAADRIVADLNRRLRREPAPEEEEP
ncbi:MAG: UDP-N-acetylglucosamine 2-epimerase (non-hydrolyzing) [Planctomycetota bacterium]